MCTIYFLSEEVQYFQPALAFKQKSLEKVFEKWEIKYRGAAASAVKKFMYDM